MTSLTKTAVNKLLVAERKSMREKQNNALFMRKTLSIYNGMKKRAADCKCFLDYNLEDLRNYTRSMTDGTIKCWYCKEVVLTIKNIAWDHDIPISRGGSFGNSNLRACCKPCNWQKGILTHQEFSDLLYAMKQHMAPEAAADVKRRLTIGGKWGVRAC